MSLRSQEPNVTRVNACSEADGGSVECMKSLRGLRAGRTYEAWVRASTVVGEGPPSVAVACQTSSLGKLMKRVSESFSFKK